MSPELEHKLGKAILTRHHTSTVRDIICELASELEFVPKQAWRTLEKWCDKGWYDYGVSIDLGWLTDKGKEVFK